MTNYRIIQLFKERYTGKYNDKIKIIDDYGDEYDLNYDELKTHIIYKNKYKSVNMETIANKWIRQKQKTLQRNAYEEFDSLLSIKLPTKKHTLPEIHKTFITEYDYPNIVNPLSEHVLKNNRRETYQPKITESYKYKIINRRNTIDVLPKI